MHTSMWSNPKVRFGVVVVGFFVFLAVLGPWLTDTVLGMDPRANDTSAIASPPSAEHWLGTTQFGQDVLAQLIAGARGSMFVGVLAALIGTALAIAFGVTAGYFGGTVDHVLNFVTNLFMVMPVLPLIFIVSGYLRGTGLAMIAVIIGVFGWAGGARTLRAQTLSVRNRDFVLGMRMLGESQPRLIAVEVLPHLTGWIASMFLGAMIGAILAEAGLAFLGISDSGSISWGSMIQAAQSQSAVMRGLWWWFVPPGLCIALIGTAAAMINFGVDELANPKLRAATRRVVRRTRRVERAVAAEGGAA
ncbi:binding-protein-dependent transport systems inner membrane component [Beutenbergia cavernae DSM 12333]|uniref:Binding-protein-dependent transport systems inner membrane component n=1 Tax=Beutenbergia cavernae (strain ATCC BAA-8 / DSM 12333 / CCUG 43141 / JCM 11478 / NBRC 16432 / NCIMB 13614 / HKI 0122) TaxID=471853 RepID=C5BY71_BEUC1|nr:ABC transporter permease [Beutenbergia cavernae]ACQ80971.1 binding-protein-dependent transport systems inner membrane component [Beutenbergia cavernae DSM 12333]